MKNPMIAKVLKEYRKKNHFTVDDVVDRLKKQNISVAVKTVYGWESGQTQPDADTLLRLCDIYGIDDILVAFGYAKNSEEKVRLSQDEKTLIGKYRAEISMQDAVKKLLDIG